MSSDLRSKNGNHRMYLILNTFKIINISKVFNIYKSSTGWLINTTQTRVEGHMQLQVKMAKTLDSGQDWGSSTDE